ncbi:MAG: AraC family transcriptional regulator [Acidovorax sp.]|uniref:AraC family transcriptional regulator n=1 Tax=Acidovorax sp. TaxID=1872122 RepID=UPI00391CAB30
MSSLSLDLSALQRRPVFTSDVRVDSHDLVAREFSDHGLKWCSGAVDTSLSKVRIRQLQLFMLQYGAEVEIRPRPFDDFVLVHLSLSGTAEMVSDGVPIRLPAGAAALIAPRHNLHMRWQQGARQLILKVPCQLLRAWAPQLLVGDTTFAHPLLPLSAVQGQQWHFLMQSLLHVSQQTVESTAHARWVDHMESNVALFLASCAQGVPALSVTTASMDQRVVGSAAGGDVRRLDKLDVYMRSRLCAPVALEDLARAAGVSVRGLNMLCQRHHGESPMALLRNLRLDAVRARLQQRPGHCVTDAALEFGFGHLGRFSSYYRERFGELPSQTAGS